MDPDEWEEAGDENPHFRALAEQIEERCRVLGLYMQQVRFAPHPGSLDPAHPDRLVLQAVFDIGEIAWRDRTQRPETEAMNKEFRELADSAQESGEDIAKRWQERFGKENGDDQPG